MSVRTRVFKDTILYSFANYITMGVGIVVSIATKAILGAVGAGYWALLKVVTSYGEYSDLGTKNAVSREIPQSAGAENTDEVLNLQNTVFSFAFSAALLAGLFAISVSILFIQDPVLKKGFYGVAFLIVVTQVYNCFLTVLRARKKIKSLSSLIVIDVVFVGCFSVLGALWKGVLGLILGLNLAAVFASVAGFFILGDKIRWQCDWEAIGSLVRIGFPMVILSYSLVTFMSLDAILIGRFIGFEDLGLYTVGLMAIQQVSALGRYLSIVLFPHAQEKFGKSRRLEDTRPYFVKATWGLVYTLPFVIGGVVFLMPVVVRYFIPEFEGGLPAMRILVLGYFFMAANEMSSSILFTVDEHKRLVPVQIVMVIWLLILDVAAIRLGYGILGVAVATAFGYLSFFLTVFLMSFTRLLGFREALRMVFTIILVFLYFTVLVYIVDGLIPIAHPILGGSLKWVLFAIAFMPAAYPFLRREKIGSLIKGLLPMNKGGEVDG